MIGVVPPDPQNLDVDARFLLANERTVLAWLRTSLTLLAGGVAVFQFGDQLPGAVAFTVGLLLLGAATAVVGGRRFTAADRAIREGRLPGRGHAPIALVVTVVALALGLVAAVLAQAYG